jgi:NAD(P)-dependent dehydrogenase (short-subunit alcohol dehydrogenase family)
MDGKGGLAALVPLGRLGLVEEVADAAAFLVTNPYAHNTVLNLDGGLSAT